MELAEIYINEIYFGSGFLLGLLLVAFIYFRILTAKIRKLRSELELEGKEVENRYQAQIAMQREDYESKMRELEIEGAKQVAVLDERNKECDRLSRELIDLKKINDEYLQLQVQYNEQLEKNKAERELLQETKAVLHKEFEATANKLFEAKQQQFNVSSRSNMETVLSPFKEQLKDFNKRVEDIYHKENTQRNQLVGQIAELQKQAQRISDDATNLATVLKGDNKLQGDWGEIVLERLLEQSGLQKGREYETQASFKNDDGRRQRPDVVVRLPDQKDIVIDAKMSLKHYELYCTTEEPVEKDAALKQHIDSIRTHIKGLSLKQYENLEGIRTLDFVFIFIPIESAYLAAIHHSPNLFKEAYDKNIVLVSPSSLMVALRTVETIWRYEKQNANAEAIANSAGKLYDQFVLVAKSLEDIGGYIQKAGAAYEKTQKQLTSGKGNVLRRVDQLKELGAKTSRSMPESLQSELEVGEGVVTDAFPLTQDNDSSTDSSLEAQKEEV